MTPLEAVERHGQRLCEFAIEAYRNGETRTFVLGVWDCTLVGEGA